MKSVLTAVSCFDAHYPHVDRPTLGAVKNFLSRNKVGLFVYGGDNLDCGSISHHNKHKPLYRTRGQMRRDLDGFERSMLSAIEELLPKNCLKVWLTGNHEDWARQLIEEQPELDGMLDFPEYLRLQKRGWLVKPQGGHFKRGKLKWIHGDVVSGSGINAVRNALNTYVENIIMGHGHTAASATKTLPHSNKHKWQAWMTGCMGKVNSGYLRGRPTGWLNQFGITEFYGTRGFFNHYPVTVIQGQFSYGGQRYSGRA